MPKLALLDPRKLKPHQLSEAKKFFNGNKSKAFLPAHQIATDTIRAALDEFVLRELLVSDMPTAIKQTAVLRRKLGEESSFNGGKV
jgi:hypothetical protein